MRFDVLTLFPGIFTGPLHETILRRALEAGLIEVHLHDLRAWATDRHRTVDDTPFGGGPGMVMKPEPLFAAVDEISAQARPAPATVLLTPQGRTLDHSLVAELAATPRLLLICGRYEGVDERVRAGLVDIEVSIGDFVTSGGELPALLLIDAVSRRVPGVLGGGAVAGRGVVRGRTARIPAVHATGGVSRHQRPRGAAIRPPREGRTVAAAHAPAAHPRARAGAARLR